MSDQVWAFNFFIDLLFGACVLVFMGVIGGTLLRIEKLLETRRSPTTAPITRRRQRPTPAPKEQANGGGE